MPMFNRSVARARLLVALPVILSTAFLAACGDDDPTFPSTAAVEDVLIQTIPQSAPFLMIEDYDDEIVLLGVPVDGQRRWVDVPVTWTSSRPSLVTFRETIGADGRPRAVLYFVGSDYTHATHVDTITITATAAGRTGTARVVVRENPRVEVVGVTAISPFLPVGAVVELTATPRDGAGNVIPAPSAWTWASTSASVATLVDNQDGTATVTIVGQGTGAITAAVVNAGEDPETGTIRGTSAISVPAALQSGDAITVGNIGAGAVADWTFTLPAGQTSFRVAITGAATGDADIYVYPPGFAPAGATGAGWICRPWLIGSVENCVITGATPGSTYGIRVHAYPDDGPVTDLGLTIVSPAP
jgi:hypothetical protein